jgi:hypothetical protein
LAAAEWALSTTRSAGDVRAAVALLEPYLARLQDAPGKESVLAPVLASYLLAFTFQGEVAYELTLQHIKLADRLGDRSQVARGISNLGLQLSRAGHDELGIMLWEKSNAIARECHDIGHLANGLGNLASALAQRDAVAATRAADEALETARRSGIAATVSNALGNVAIGRWPVGDWDTVEGIVRSESLGLDGEAVVASAAALVYAARGRDPAELAEWATEVEATVFYLDLARAVAQAFSGDRAAVATVTRALDGAFDLSGIYEDFTLVYDAALQIAVRFADAALLDRLRRVADTEGHSLPAGMAGHRALLTALDAERVGDPDAVAEEGFAEALRRYEAWGSRVHLARTKAAYGVWLTKRGRIAEAEPLLTEARAAYASFGAVAWLEELEQALATQGVGQ